MFNIRHIINWLAVILSPVAPAYFVGYAVANKVGEFAGTWGLLAPAIGLAAALALEIMGISAGHNAVRAFGLGRTIPALVSTACLVLYAGIGIYEVNFGTNGAAFFLVAILAYVQQAVSESLDFAVSESQAEASETREYQRAEKAKDNAARRDREAKRQQAKAEIAILEARAKLQEAVNERVESENEQESPAITCPHCEKPFGHQNGLNAHIRHCPKLAVNGVAQ